MIFKENYFNEKFWTKMFIEFESEFESELEPDMLAGEWLNF